MPLNDQYIDERLQAPDIQAIFVDAENICHPALKPIRIDESNGLTPDQAAVLAVLINPTLQAERDKKGVALAQVIQAGILPNPIFSSTADFPYSSPTPGNVNAYMFNLSWNPISLLSLSDQIDAAKAHASSVELDIAWQEWQVAEKAKQQVYRLILIQRQLDTAKQGEEQLRHNRDAIKQAVSQGNRSIIDLSAVEASLDAVHLSVLSIEQNFEIERLSLNETIGVPPDYPITINHGIQSPILQPLPGFDELFNGLASRRFDLLALRIGYESEEATLRTAIINQIPAINIGPSISRDNTDVKMKGLVFAMELPVFNRNQGKIAIEQATRLQLYDEFIARLFTARAQIANILANMDYLQRQVEFTMTTIDALKELTRTYNQALLEGNADVVTYYNAVNNLIAKEIDLLKLQQLYVDQYIALEIAAGEFLTSECVEAE